MGPLLRSAAERAEREARRVKMKKVILRIGTEIVNGDWKGQCGGLGWRKRVRGAEEMDWVRI